MRRKKAEWMAMQWEQGRPSRSAWIQAQECNGDLSVHCLVWFTSLHCHGVTVAPISNAGTLKRSPKLQQGISFFSGNTFCVGNLIVMSSFSFERFMLTIKWKKMPLIKAFYVCYISYESLQSARYWIFQPEETN